MGLIRKRESLAQDDNGFVQIVILGIIAGVSLLGTYYLTKPVGEGIGDAFTLFGESISLYVVVGLTLLGLIFLWLVFGRK